MTNYWKVHMRFKEEGTRIYDDYNASNKLITIYWNKIGDLHEYSYMDKDEVEQELELLLKKCYPDESDETRRNWKTYIRNFAWNMQVGDFVLSPTQDGRCFLGIIESGYFYYQENHHRKVDWTILSRSVLSDELNKSVGTPGTVTSLNPYREDIGKLFLKDCVT